MTETTGAGCSKTPVHHQMQAQMPPKGAPGSSAYNAIPPSDSPPGWEGSCGVFVEHSIADGFVQGR